MASSESGLSRFLNRLLIRSVLGREEQAAILGLNGTVKQFRANQGIVSPGETVDHACLIADGLAGRYDQMADGQRQLTAVHIEGDMADLHSVVSPTAAWGIVALTSTAIFYVRHKDLRELTRSYPAIAFAFWRDTVTDASILAKWLGNVGRRDARARIAHLICEMAVRIEAAGLGSRNEFELDISQSNLADAIGLTSVHVNRVLQILRGENLIRTQARMVIIEDWSRLASAAGFDPDYLLMEHRG